MLPIICKIIETVVRDRIQPNILNVQNTSQSGFTAGSSPLNAALIVEEFYCESKDNNSQAHLILLDAKAASALKGTHFFYFYLPSLQLVLCSVAAVKRLPVHQS